MLLCPVQFSFCIEGELAVPTLKQSDIVLGAEQTWSSLNTILSWSQWRLNGYRLRPDLTRYIINVHGFNVVKLYD